jgi:hypothetical protein
MKACEQWREELTEHALGEPASAGLAEHLTKCEVCSAVLREWEARMGEVDAAVRRTVVEESPAGAVERVMAEVRAQGHGGWSWRWKWQAVVVCGLIVAVGAFAYTWKERKKRAEAQRVLSAAWAISEWKSPTESLLEPATSANRLLRAAPQFGRYFYQLKTTVPEKARENP